MSSEVSSAFLFYRNRGNRGNSSPPICWSMIPWLRPSAFQSQWLQQSNVITYSNRAERHQRNTQNECKEIREQFLHTDKSLIRLAESYHLHE